ncbi:MAG: aminopeptidase P family protein, partial [Alphaproteobacteria bacterium]|nr:aminopeptidase P family protein [Alphaproteobacteria bacterium]
MATATDRLASLRGSLAAAGVDGFVVPHTDEHQNEYLPARAERLAWLTGFTGSAGAAVVLAARAAVFADGRYTLQVRREVDPALWEICHLVEQPLADWLATAAKPGMRIGYDPWLHTPSGLERLAEGCRKAGASLVALATNPVDIVWAGQPTAPVTPAKPHDLAYAGRAGADKRADIAGRLAADGLDAAIVTQPDSIAWLLNVRGNDVAHTPLVLSFVVLHADATVDWYVDPAKLGPDMGGHLGNAVRVNPPDALGAGLDRLAGKRVRACPDTAASWVFERLAAAGADIRRGPDPVTLPKAIKNEVELAGTRAAHRRDGAALARFLAWLGPAAAAGDLFE